MQLCPGRGALDKRLAHIGFTIQGLRPVSQAGFAGQQEQGGRQAAQLRQNLMPAGKRRSCNTNVNSLYSRELIRDLDQLSRID